MTNKDYKTWLDVAKADSFPVYSQTLYTGNSKAHRKYEYFQKVTVFDKYSIIQLKLPNSIKLRRQHLNGSV